MLIVFSALSIKLLRLPLALLVTLLFVNIIGYWQFGRISQFVATATLIALAFQLGLSDHTLQAKLTLSKNGSKIDGYQVAVRVFTEQLVPTYFRIVLIATFAIVINYSFGINAFILILLMLINSIVSAFISSAERANRHYVRSSIPEVIVWPLTALGGLVIFSVFDEIETVVVGLIASSVIITIFLVIWLLNKIRDTVNSGDIDQRVKLELDKPSYKKRAVLLFKNARSELIIAFVPIGSPEIAGHFRVVFQILNLLTMPRQVMNLKVAEYLREMRILDRSRLKADAMLSHALTITFGVIVVGVIAWSPGIIDSLLFADIWYYVTAIIVVAIAENADGVNTRLIILMNKENAQFNVLIISLLAFLLVFAATLIWNHYAIFAFLALILSSIIRNIGHARIASQIFKKEVKVTE